MKSFFVALCALFPAVAQGVELSGTEWKSPFYGDPQNVQLQYSYKFTSATELQQVFRVKASTPIGDTAFLMTFHAVYALGAAVPGLPHAQAFDLTAVRVTETPLDESIVESFNDDAECGFTDWEVGVAKDITGIVCTPGEEPVRAGDKLYDIVGVQGDRLQTGFLPEGDASVGTTPENRPVALDDAITYARVTNP